MSKLLNLKPNFTSLSESERLSLVLAIRLSRRTSKRTQVEKKARPLKALKNSLDLGNLNTQQLADLEAQLLAILEEED